MVQNYISLPFEVYGLILFVFIEREPDLKGAVFALASNIDVLVVILIRKEVSIGTEISI